MCVVGLRREADQSEHIETGCGHFSGRTCLSFEMRGSKCGATWHSAAMHVLPPVSAIIQESLGFSLTVYAWTERSLGRMERNERASKQAILGPLSFLGAAHSLAAFCILLASAAWRFVRDVQVARHCGRRCRTGVGMVVAKIAVVVYHLFSSRYCSYYEMASIS